MNQRTYAQDEAHDPAALARRAKEQGAAPFADGQSERNPNFADGANRKESHVKHAGGVPDMLRHLQRTAGNRAVGQLLRQQAAASAAPATALQRHVDAVVQREEDKEELQMKRDTLQRGIIMEGPEDEELQKKSEVGAEGGALSSGLSSRIEQARGGGASLDGSTRERMEDAFGTGFGDVRVHTDAKSDTLNRNVSATAFTTGNDVFFRQGAYQPGSREGHELLAHELTHVVQQRSMGGGGGMHVGPAGNSYEQEADAAGASVASTIERSSSEDDTAGAAR